MHYFFIALLLSKIQFLHTCSNISNHAHLRWNLFFWIKFFAIKYISIIPSLWLQKHIPNSLSVRMMSIRTVAGRFEMVFSDFKFFWFNAIFKHKNCSGIRKHDLLFNPAVENTLYRDKPKGGMFIARARSLISLLVIGESKPYIYPHLPQILS